MSNDAGTITLPLLTLGLPARMSGWLLDAGLPTAPLETSAVRRGIAPDDSGRSIVLYDSRNASARADADAAGSLGYQTIDAARLLTTRTFEDDPDLTVVPAADPRRRFFDALRPAIESAGGLWIRISDFPHPFRGALCGDEATDPDQNVDHEFATALTAFGELPADGGLRASPGRLTAADWFRSCVTSGRPVRVEGEVADATVRYGIESEIDRSPLVWQTTLDDFCDWWRFRRRIGLRAVRHGRSCEIDVAPPAGLSRPGRFTAAVEIWRGRHSAVLPVRPGRTMIRDDLLPFQFNATRLPAGFTADATDPDLAGLPERPILTAPA